MSVEKKRTFNKLKHDLEPWRNVLVYMDSIISWEQSYYPAILCTVITLFYILLWTMNLSIITMASVIGLIIIAVDFGYSSVTLPLFKTGEWNSRKEDQFDEVLTKILYIKDNIFALHEYVLSGRKSTKFAVIICLILLIVAYIGAVLNNLLIMYILSMLTAMYPGTIKRKVLNKIKDKVRRTFNSKITEKKGSENVKKN